MALHCQLHILRRMKAMSQVLNRLPLRTPGPLLVPRITMALTCSIQLSARIREALVNLAASNLTNALKCPFMVQAYRLIAI